MQKEAALENADAHEEGFIDKSARSYSRCKSKNSAQGYVYFVQGMYGGAIKIGHSSNPQDRLRELQTGYPDTLRMLLIIPGSERTEKALHHIFRAYRLRGEWFKPDPVLVAKIKELAVKFNVMNEKPIALEGSP